MSPRGPMIWDAGLHPEARLAQGNWAAPRGPANSSPGGWGVPRGQARGLGRLGGTQRPDDLGNWVTLNNPNPQPLGNTQPPHACHLASGDCPASRITVCSLFDHCVVLCPCIIEVSGRSPVSWQIGPLGVTQPPESCNLASGGTPASRAIARGSLVATLFRRSVGPLGFPQLPNPWGLWV